MTVFSFASRMTLPPAPIVGIGDQCTEICSGGHSRDDEVRAVNGIQRIVFGCGSQNLTVEQIQPAGYGQIGAAVVVSRSHVDNVNARVVVHGSDQH